MDNRNPFCDTSDPDSEGKPVAHFNKTNINYVLCVNVFWEDSGYAEGMNIPGRQPLRSDDDSALAKSLPMRVPAMSNYRSQDIDIEEDKVIMQNLTDALIHFGKFTFLLILQTPVNPEEMAASIKAIARSVHGGSDSFWDLPRPRLNTLH